MSLFKFFLGFLKNQIVNVQDFSQNFKALNFDFGF